VAERASESEQQWRTSPTNECGGSGGGCGTERWRSLLCFYEIHLRSVHVCVFRVCVGPTFSVIIGGGDDADSSACPPARLCRLIRRRRPSVVRRRPGRPERRRESPPPQSNRGRQHCELHGVRTVQATRSTGGGAIALLPPFDGDGCPHFALLCVCVCVPLLRLSQQPTHSLARLPRSFLPTYSSAIT
jgi:hypothetical protein